MRTVTIDVYTHAPANRTPATPRPEAGR
jgi:hypothetical protein